MTVDLGKLDPTIGPDMHISYKPKMDTPTAKRAGDMLSMLMKAVQPRPGAKPADKELGEIRLLSVALRNFVKQNLKGPEATTILSKIDLVDKVLPTTQKTDASAKAQLAPKVPIPALAKTTKTKTPFLAPRKEAELSHLAELTYKLKQTSTDELSKNPLLLRNTTRQLNELLVNCLAAGEEMHFESLLQLHPFLIGPCDEADIEIILEAAEPGSWVLWYENALSEEGGMVRKELVGSIKEATGEIKHLTAADIAELSQDSIVNFHNLTPLNKSQHAEVLRLKDPVTQKIAAEIQKQFGESEMFRYDEGQAQTAAKKSIGQPIIHMHKNIQAPTPSSPQQDPTHFFITYSLDGRKTNQLDCKVTYDEDNDVLSVEVPLPSDDVLAGASEFLLDDSFIERIKACFEIQSRGKK